MQHGGMGRRTLAVIAVWALALALIVGVSLGACGLPGGTITQGVGLQDLHPLNWGYHLYSDAVWSPNGKWIALEAGSGATDRHLVVVSPDGSLRKDLRDWNCGQSQGFDIAWLPDSTLSCINDTELIIGGYPFDSPTHAELSATLLTEDRGAVWARDGQTLLVASESTLTPGVADTGNPPPQLYVVHRDGSIIPTALTPPSEQVWAPAWGVGPQAGTLTYQMSTDPLGVVTDLLQSSVTYAKGIPASVGQPKELAHNTDDFYVWSPSGRWIAVRYSDYRSGDRIYVLDPANPSHTVDVVLADKAGVQMMDPIWSPDGQTLIVFSVGYDTSMPYKLDIGAYLKSKGLQP